MDTEVPEPERTPANNKHKLEYVGNFDRRILSKKDLSGAGIKVPRDLDWNSGNGFVVEVDLSDKALEFLRSQPDIKVK